MTAETYVRQILKKVHCSSAKKTEIKKQLLADIKERTLRTAFMKIFRRQSRKNIKETED